MSDEKVLFLGDIFPTGYMAAEEEFDPSIIISHRLSLDKTSEGYKIFRDKEDNCTKVILKP